MQGKNEITMKMLYSSAPIWSDKNGKSKLPTIMKQLIR